MKPIKSAFRKKLSRQLIVNADDLGMSKGISDGIFQAHQKGIVTSASLIMSMPATNYAVSEMKKHPALSIGLHGALFINKGTVSGYIEELEHQLKSFIKLSGKKPTHFDFHGVPIPTKTKLFAIHCFISKHKLTCRGNDNIKVINRYYGMKGNKTIKENISISALSSILITLKPGVSLIVCHPGITNNRLSDPYRLTRNKELEVLTSEKILALIDNERIQLINYLDLV